MVRLHNIYSTPTWYIWYVYIIHMVRLHNIYGTPTWHMGAITARQKIQKLKVTKYEPVRLHISKSWSNFFWYVKITKYEPGNYLIWYVNITKYAPGKWGQWQVAPAGRGVFGPWCLRAWRAAASRSRGRGWCLMPFFFNFFIFWIYCFLCIDGFAG